MPKKLDSDATSGAKLLKLFRKLMAEGKKHFLSDLARELIAHHRQLCVL